jgi:type IV secretory pathway TraG/TraD family ATPase VirD4
MGAEDFITQRLELVGDQRAIRAWKAHRSTHEKTKSSIVATAYNLLEGWSSEVMAKVTNTRDGEGDLLDIDRLLDERGTLYLIASNADKHIYRAVFESVLNAIVRRVQEREEASGRPLRPALLLSLDEAANIAPLRDLAHIVSCGRGQGIIVESVWQDLAQIRRIYRDAAEEVRSNQIAKVYLKGISDVGTLNELSTLLGKTVRSTINHSRDLHDQRRSVSMSEDEVDLATPRELRRLGPDEILAIVEHYKPIKLTVPAWFESPAMRTSSTPESHSDGRDVRPRPRRRPAHRPPWPGPAPPQRPTVTGEVPDRWPAIDELASMLNDLDAAELVADFATPATTWTLIGRSHSDHRRPVLPATTRRSCRSSRGCAWWPCGGRSGASGLRRPGGRSGRGSWIGLLVRRV